MYRVGATVGTIVLYLLLFCVLPAIADDGSVMDARGMMGNPGGGSQGLKIILAIAIVVGAHFILKAIDRDYIFTIIGGCIGYFVIAIISYQVFDYQMGLGWFITIFAATIFLDKHMSS
jgi:hypothetical protein